eukprot:gene4989-5108_t
MAHPPFPREPADAREARSANYIGTATEKMLPFVLGILAPRQGGASVARGSHQMQAILPPSQLRVEYMPPSGSDGSPLTVVHTPSPSFSWALNHGRRGARQAAFRLLLNATSGPHQQVAWDSGVVATDRSVAVPYGGPAPLRSDADYLWTVSWSDELGSWSGASAPAGFSTGLLAGGNADWNGTRWAGGLAAADDRNQLRLSF